MILEGTGLHGGRPARVQLVRRAGPVAMRVAGHEAPVRELAVVGTVRAMTVAHGPLRLRTVDHLFAALAGMGIRDGLLIDVEGDELPLLDGSAAAWCAALARLAVPPSPPAMRVTRAAVIEERASRFELTPGDDVELDVEVEFGDARLAAHASWRGDVGDFVGRIAPARTFAFAHEIAGLLQRGLAQHVAPESVLVIAPDVIHAAGPAFSADEPARHKLLDLAGDLYVYGGPPRGRLRAFRPGHGATHAAMAQAVAQGIVAPIESLVDGGGALLK